MPCSNSSADYLRLVGDLLVFWVSVLALVLGALAKTSIQRKEALLLRAASFGKTKASLLAMLRLEEKAKDVEEEEEEEQDAEQQELLRCRCRTLAAAAAAAAALAFAIPPDVDIVVIARISFLNKPRFCACYMCHSRPPPRGKCRLFRAPILSRRHFLLPLLNT